MRIDDEGVFVGWTSVIIFSCIFFLLFIYLVHVYIFI